MAEMRLVKCEEELNFIRESAKLSDFGQSIWQDMVKSGRLMIDVDVETVKQMYIEAARMFAGAKVECHSFNLSGPASASPHSTSADSGMTIEKGHGIVNIIIVRLNGYVVENERTWFVGEPTDLQVRAFNTAQRATDTAIKQMVAGNPVSSIDSAAQGVIEGQGSVTTFSTELDTASVLRVTSFLMMWPSATGP